MAHAAKGHRYTKRDSENAKQQSLYHECKMRVRARAQARPADVAATRGPLSAAGAVCLSAKVFECRLLCSETQQASLPVQRSPDFPRLRPWLPPALPRPARRFEAARRQDVEPRSTIQSLRPLRSIALRAFRQSETRRTTFPSTVESRSPTE